MEERKWWHERGTKAVDVMIATAVAALTVMLLAYFGKMPVSLTLLCAGLVGVIVWGVRTGKRLQHTIRLIDQAMSFRERLKFLPDNQANNPQIWNAWTNQERAWLRGSGYRRKALALCEEMQKAQTTGNCHAVAKGFILGLAKTAIEGRSLGD